MNLWTIFITGLTTGGLSCLAMQGGILTSAIANQKEEELEIIKKHSSSKKKLKQLDSTNTFDQLDWLPVSLFLGGKLISHTLFGFFLGFLGSQIELSLTAKLIFQAGAAVFMFATAMNLLDVHPIFRYVVIQPPRFFTRMIKNSSKSKAMFTPFVLGFMTVLIPCGVTQAMEVLAMTSGNPVLGASIMFVFVLGTMPIFAVLGLGVARLSEIWSKTFMKVAAYSLIFLAASGLNGILVVLDAPITWQKIYSTVFDPAGLSSANSLELPQVVDGRQQVALNVYNSGYSPNRLVVKAGVPVDLQLITQDTYSCAVDFMMPQFNIRTFLKPTGSEIVQFTPPEPGRYTFTCSMGMYTGYIEAI